MVRHRTFARIFADIPASALADGLTQRSAVNTAWAAASPDSWRGTCVQLPRAFCTPVR